MINTSGWYKVRIEDICTLVTSGGTPSRKLPKYYKGSIPWFKTGELKDGNLYDSEEKITGEAIKQSSAKIYPVDTVLMAMYGDGRTIGSLGVTKVPAASNQACCAMKTNENKCYYRFLFYSLQVHRRKIISLALGGAQRNLNQGTLKNYEIELPPLETQHKIASILSSYDDLIENNTRRIKILEEMARMAYREWFVNFHFPGREQVRLVDSSLGLIPEGWEVVELQIVCDRITDGSHTSPETRSEGYPMASVKDMHDYGLNIQGCRKISEVDYVDLVRNDCKVKKNDVLIAKDGSYLKHCFVVENDIDVVLLSSIAMLRPNSHIRPHLLAMILKDPEVKERMRGYVSGVAIPRIVLKDFRAFQIVLPPKHLQDTWGGLVEPLVKLIWKINSKNQNLRQTRDLLLPKLISGEVAV